MPEWLGWLHYGFIHGNVLIMAYSLENVQQLVSGVLNFLEENQVPAQFASGSLEMVFTF